MFKTCLSPKISHLFICMVFSKLVPLSKEKKQKPRTIFADGNGAKSKNSMQI